MLGIIMPVIIWQSWGWGTFIWSSILYTHGTGQHGRWMNSDVVWGYTRCLSSFGEVGSSMGCMWELDGLKPSFHGYRTPVWGLCAMGCMWESDGLRPSFHGLDVRVRRFEAFIPWVGHGSRTVWGLHSMGWMWESDSLKLKFHGLYVGVWHFEVWEFEVFIPWVEHSSLMFTFESSILKFKC